MRLVVRLSISDRIEGLHLHVDVALHAASGYTTLHRGGSRLRDSSEHVLYPAAAAAIDAIGAWLDGGSPDLGLNDPREGPGIRHMWGEFLGDQMLAPVGEVVDAGIREGNLKVLVVPADPVAARLPVECARWANAALIDRPGVTIVREPSTLSKGSRRAAPRCVGWFTGLVLSALSAERPPTGWPEEFTRALTQRGATPWSGGSTEEVSLGEPSELRQRLQGSGGGRPDLLVCLGDGHQAADGGWLTPGGTITWTALARDIREDPPSAVILATCHSAAAAGMLVETAGVPLSIGFEGLINTDSTIRLLMDSARRHAGTLFRTRAALADDNAASPASLADDVAAAVWEAYRLTPSGPVPVVWMNPGSTGDPWPARIAERADLEVTPWYTRAQLIAGPAGDHLVRIPLPEAVPDRTVRISFREGELVYEGFGALDVAVVSKVIRLWDGLQHLRVAQPIRRRGGDLVELAGRSAELAALVRGLGHLLGERIPDAVWKLLTDATDEDFGAVDAAPRLHVVTAGVVRRYSSWPALELVAQAGFGGLVGLDAMAFAMSVSPLGDDVFVALNDAFEGRDPRPLWDILLGRTSDYRNVLEGLKDARGSAELLGTWIRNRGRGTVGVAAPSAVSLSLIEDGGGDRIGHTAGALDFFRDR